VCTLLTNWGQLNEEEKKQMYRPDAKPDIQTPEEKTGVKMMTMHKSKGLEFDNVFVCGLSERTKNGMENNQEEKNEECRLHYVAYSRAKENLYIVESSLSNYSIFTNEVKDLFEKKGKLEEEDFDDDFEIC
jgi:superfamily I DNA/RNA helicase